MKDIRCLIISHAFNMDGRAASQTITDKIPFLLERNWKIWVLSAITGIRDTRFPHRQLFALGPSGFRFDFRHWCSIRFGRGWVYRILTATVSALLLPLIIIERIIIGYSSQWSWTIPAVFHGVVWIKKYKISVIYSSGGAWSAHLAGWCLKRLTGVRWIAEIHDPLVQHSVTTDPGSLSKRSREEIVRQKIENLICTNSTLCWWFTERALHNARIRNPILGDRGFSLLPGAQPPNYRASYESNETLSIGHFGSLSESRSLVNLVEALAEFFEIYPQRHGKLKLNLYGGFIDRQTLDSIKKKHCDDSVIFHERIENDPVRGRTGREQIHLLMQKCDFLLLLHGSDQSCSEYIPSKLYEYWWAQRPILAFTHDNQQLDQIIMMISKQNKICSSTAPIEAKVELFCFAWDRWVSGAINTFESDMQPISPSSAVVKIHQRVISDFESCEGK